MNATPLDRQAAIVPMTMAHYDQLYQLWRETDGVSVRSADSRESTERYLTRNPTTCFVVIEAGSVIGGVMCGHDGRRGYLQHLVVKPEFQRRGWGRALTEKCIADLAALGIHKTHLFVFTENTAAQEFWRSLGWEPRSDVRMFSFNSSRDRNV